MGESGPSRRKFVHQALNGGLVAEVLFWKNWCGGVIVLVSSTSLAATRMVFTSDYSVGSIKDCSLFKLPFDIFPSISISLDMISNFFSSGFQHGFHTCSDFDFLGSGFQLGQR
ncbi:hypothetical protein K1719_023802 [Acacia pycnantha]|nr:hypothetical protein K1719_023802 [Acacia pycnantha]